MVSRYRCCFIDFLSLQVTLADAMHSMDIQRDPGLLTCMFSFMSHVLDLCTCISLVLFHMSFHFTILDCRLVCTYVSRLRLLLLSC